MPTLPVTTIGGYLGAGKTTLVNQVLRHAGGRRLAVLVNEFGALPIDEDLIEAEGSDIISLAGGCICCSFGDDLIGALMQLSDMNPPPEHILIEASGVAIPASIAASISLLPRFRLNGVVVLADCETIRAASRDIYLGDTILRQLKDADLVIATKTDLVGESAAGATCDWLGSVADHARIISAARGRVPVDILLGPSDTHEPRPTQGHSDALFDSVLIRADGPVDARQLAAQLTGEDFGVVRAKGFVVDTNGKPVLLQIVGQRWEVSGGKPGADPVIVCIGLSGQLNKPALQRLFASLASQVTEPTSD